MRGADLLWFAGPLGGLGPGRRRVEVVPGSLTVLEAQAERRLRALGWASLQVHAAGLEFRREARGSRSLCRTPFYERLRFCV